MHEESFRFQQFLFSQRVQFESDFLDTFSYGLYYSVISL